MKTVDHKAASLDEWWNGLITEAEEKRNEEALCEFFRRRKAPRGYFDWRHWAHWKWQRVPTHHQVDVACYVRIDADEVAWIGESTKGRKWVRRNIGKTRLTSLLNFRKLREECELKIGVSLVFRDAEGKMRYFLK